MSAALTLWVMSFSVMLADGSSVDFPDSATYQFKKYGVLSVRARCPGERYEYTNRHFAPLRWTDVVASHHHGPGVYRDRDKWLGGMGVTTLGGYKQEDDPEFLPN